jgi:hypothetical protein
MQSSLTPMPVNFTAPDRPRPRKKAVAARAGWRCSLTGCFKLTVGPSEEFSDAITTIGVAAHICAASPGGRRYIASMTPEKRASIDNAIWLCADHATVIDRDEVTYTVEKLRTMKREHETACAQVLRTGSSPDLGAGLLAIGPDIVCTGDISNIAAATWTLRVRHFVIGDRVLSQAPNLTKQTDGYRLLCSITPGFPRIDAGLKLPAIGQATEGWTNAGEASASGAS